MSEAPLQQSSTQPEDTMSIWKDIVRPESQGLVEDYNVGKALGKGAFGTVFLAMERRSGELVAVKTISKAKLVGKEDVEDVRREVEILSLISPHKCIAGLRGVYEDRCSVHIVMDLCQGGELFDRIVRKGTLSEAGAARFFRQMVEMCQHCHSVGVAHRDLKPENFLLTSDADDCDLRACDFGLSTYFKPGQHFSALVGSPYYVAPEVLRRDYEGPPPDVWSLGVILYILLCGVPPFWGDTEKEIFKSVLRGELDLTSAPWPGISEAAKDLVRKMLNPDPAARPTPARLLEHPWLREHGVAPDRPLDSIVLQRMKNFANMHKLKRVAILAAAQHLTYEQIHGLRELFKSFDKNGDGLITLDELREGLAAQGGAAMGQDEVAGVMASLDVDGSGALDYEEFLAATVNLALLEREDLLAKAFAALDTDGSGALSLDEVAAAVGQAGRMPEAEARELIAAHDTNGDGVIDYAEFLAMLRGGDEQLAAAASRVRSGLSGMLTL